MSEPNTVQSVPPPPTITERSDPVEWSQAEYLYIQLYAELLFATDRLEEEPLVFTNEITAHKQFRQFFASRDVAEGGTKEERPEKSPQDFTNKRDRLVGGLLWRIQRTATARARAQKPKVRAVDITPALLEQYQKLREAVGTEKVITYPEEKPELWKFLFEEARQQYDALGLSTVVTQESQLPDMSSGAKEVPGPAQLQTTPKTPLAPSELDVEKKVGGASPVPLAKDEDKVPYKEQQANPDPSTLASVTPEPQLNGSTPEETHQPQEHSPTPPTSVATTPVGSEPPKHDESSKEPVAPEEVLDDPSQKVQEPTPAVEAPTPSTKPQKKAKRKRAAPKPKTAETSGPSVFCAWIMDTGKRCKRPSGPITDAQKKKGWICHNHIRKWSTMSEEERRANMVDTSEEGEPSSKRAKIAEDPAEKEGKLDDELEGEAELMDDVKIDA